MTEWSQVELGRVLSLEYGKPLPAAQRDEDGGVVVAGSNGPHGVHSEALVRGPGVVVGRKGSAGRVYWYDADFWPIDTTYFVRPRIPMDMRWAYYLLSHLHLERLATSTGVPGLNRNDAYGIGVALPPPSEQRRIAELLDEADRLRRLRTAADGKADRILSALLARIIGSPSSWPSDPRSRALGELIDPVSGATPSKANPEYWDGVLPWVSPKDMKRDFLSDAQDHVSQIAVAETNLKVVEPNNVLIVVRGMILARDVPVALNLRPVTINQDMKALLPRTREVSGPFVWAALRLAKASLQALVRTAGHGTRKLDTPELMMFPVVVPSARQLGQVDVSVRAHRHFGEQRERGKAKLTLLFAVLLRHAFDGVLTASWRKAHMKELLEEMDHQSRAVAAIPQGD